MGEFLQWVGILAAALGVVACLGGSVFAYREKRRGSTIAWLAAAPVVGVLAYVVGALVVGFLVVLAAVLLAIFAITS